MRIHPGPLCKATTSVISAAVILVATAGPAAADPAAPTNYESAVLYLDPPAPGARFEVIGGDSFLQVTVEPGHEVVVPGYSGEPYVRIDADGSVWLNLASRAYYINEDRYAQAEVPAWVDDPGEPHWQQVGSDGTYPWHDHRIHWMSPNLPPAITGDTRQTVFPWELPVIVDGTTSMLGGELVWTPSRSFLPPLLAGIIVLLPLVVWRRSTTVAALLIAAAAAVGVVIAVLQNNGTPAPARGLPFWALFPLLALAAAAAAIWKRTDHFAASRFTAIGGIMLVAWALSTFEVLSLPVLLSPLPPAVERVGVALILWVGVGAAAVAAMTLLRPAPRAQNHHRTGPPQDRSR